MAVLIDVPMWPRHGTLWAHLVSDTSYDELHAFARRAGLPPRSFDLDHYDVPAERHDELVGLGARAVDGRELVRRLIASGLRVPGRQRAGSSGGGGHDEHSRGRHDDPRRGLHDEPGHGPGPATRR